MISAAKLTPLPITISNIDIPFTQNGKLLGLSITCRGIAPHARERARLANLQLSKCRRFSGCSEKTKLHLYKALIRPIIEYPPIPLNTISNSLMLELQAVQNKALISVAGCRYPNIPTAKSLHERYEITPINIQIHEQAKRTWEKLEMSENPNYLKIT